jgi:hypothetical protein
MHASEDARKHLGIKTRKNTQIALCNAFPFAMQRFGVALWNAIACIAKYLEYQYPGLKPWADSICPYRAINARV